ncbi:MAG TPA: APC family permease [Ilumatobacter sp.]
MATTKPDPGVGARHEGTVESVYAGDSGVDRLKPNAIGLWGVIFVAVTGAAPISAMLFNVPFSVGFGTGLYTPAAFLFATIILTIFAIGYVAMAKKMRAAGGFYTFISHGLGRELGLAAGITGALSYALFEVSLLGGFSYFASTNFNDWFGWSIPWIAFALFAALLISVLCFFDVELSVKVLGFALIGEVIILTIFDLLVFGDGGGTDGIHLEALNVFKLTDPGVGLAAGVGLFLAFWSWVGFEAIPNYAEESKNPQHIVPRATLLSVVGLGIGYVLTSLAFVSAFPESTLIKDAQNPDGPFFVAMESYGTEWLKTLMQVLILTGSFACAMAFHNVAMRYFYAMGREGILPKSFGRTHKTHRSPYIASIAQTAFALVLVLAWGIGAGFGFGDAFDTAYVRIYTMMAVQGVVWILAIQAACALAVILWHRRHKHPDSWVVVTLCPIIAIAGQVFAIYLLFANIDTLAGTIGYVDLIAPIAVVGVVGALVYAVVLKRTNRKKFDVIGRMIDEGVTP